MHSMHRITYLTVLDRDAARWTNPKTRVCWVAACHLPLALSFAGKVVVL